MAWDSVGPSFSRQDKSILFVFGAARSGTTILNNLLYRHFGYGMGPEGTFVAQWARRLPRYGDLADDRNLDRLIADVSECEMLHICRHKYQHNPRFDVSPKLIREHLLERSYAGVVYSVFECMAELQNCPRVGNKNPGFWQHYDLLHKLFPTQAKYLCIVRDGRDVSLSIVKTRWGVSSSYIAAKVWAQSLMALEEMQRQFDPGRLHVISYENLLRKPHKTLEGVRDFLGVPPEEANIDAAVTELTEGSRSANFDKWKQEMSPRDLSIFEGIAGPWLEKFGYELSGNPAGVGLLDRWFYEAKEFSRLVSVNLRYAFAEKR